MQNSALARGHGREIVRRAGLSNFVGGNPRRHTQFFQTCFAMAHAIKVDLLVLVARKAQHLHGQQFERAKQFGPTLEQKRSIWPRELYEDFGTLPVAVLGHRRIDGDAIFQLESGVLDHAGEKCVELVCRFDFVHKKLRAMSGEHMSYLRFASSRLTAHSYLSFFLALLAAISRISRPSVVRFMIDCWVIIIKLLSA